MSKFTLSVPQKYLTGCLVVVFVACALLLSYLGYNGYQENAIRPIGLEKYAVIPLGADGQELIKGIRFNESFKQPSGYATLSSSEGKIVLLPGAEGTFSPAEINLIHGKVYLQVNSTFTINLGANNTFRLENVGGVLDADKPAFYVFAGNVSLNETDLTVNDYLQVVGSNLTFGKLDRNDLKLNSWESTIKTLQAAALAPQSLTDLEAPKIVSLDPGAGSSITDELLVLVGKLSEPVSKATINGQSMKVNSSLDFVEGVKLELGNNQINFELTDIYGNSQEHSFSYTRVDPTTEGQSSSSSTSPEEN